jgi:hypothetical protein
LNWLPSEKAQLAWIGVSGANARAADFEFVAAPTTVGTPIDEVKNIKLKVIAEIEVLETFVILTRFEGERRI